MKKIFLFLFLVGTSGVVLFLLYSLSRQTIRHLASPLPTVAPVPTERVANPTPTPYSVKLGDKTYDFYFHKIEHNETLDLIPNFEEATSSSFIFQKNNCSFGINGGFYMANRQPLGLFAAGRIKKGEYVTSTTFNGFLYQSATDSAKIDFTYALNINPRNWQSYNYIFQTGPLYFLKDKNRPTFTDENPARRHLIARNINGELYLFSVFEKDNLFNGPRLEEIYAFFENPEVKKIADFELVLNLDGGSASAFYDKNVQVVEFKPVGSFLCGK